MSTSPSPTDSKTDTAVGVHELHLEVAIEAPPEDVWKALT